MRSQAPRTADSVRGGSGFRNHDAVEPGTDKSVFQSTPRSAGSPARGARLRQAPTRRSRRKKLAFASWLIPCARCRSAVPGCAGSHRPRRRRGTLRARDRRTGTSIVESPAGRRCRSGRRGDVDGVGSPRCTRGMRGSGPFRMRERGFSVTVRYAGARGGHGSARCARSGWRGPVRARADRGADGTLHAIDSTRRRTGDGSARAAEPARVAVVRFADRRRSGASSGVRCVYRWRTPTPSILHLVSDGDYRAAVRAAAPSRGVTHVFMRGDDPLPARRSRRRTAGRRRRSDQATMAAARRGE